MLYLTAKLITKYELLVSLRVKEVYLFYVSLTTSINS
jgi:hypothetical protein